MIWKSAATWTSDLLPLSKERAYELMERDLTVYIIQEGENPAMAFDTADLDAHDGIFAVSREEWEESPEFDEVGQGPHGPPAGTGAGVSLP